MNSSIKNNAHSNSEHKKISLNKLQQKSNIKEPLLTPLYETIQEYIDSGFRLTLLDGKRPIEKDWVNTKVLATKVLEQAQKKQLNVGVILEDIHLIIDIDPRNYLEGRNSLDELHHDLGLKQGVLLDCPYVETGGGGYHLYFLKPVDLSIVSKLDKYPGIEFKTKGCQVVAAGSIHPETKKIYEAVFFLRALDEIYEAPTVLLDLIKRNIKDTNVIIESGEINNEQLAEALIFLPVENYKEHDVWFKLMAACHFITNGEGLQAFIDWSTSDPEYKDHASIIKTRWNSLNTGKRERGALITGAFLHQEVQKYGGWVNRTLACNDFPVWSETIGSIEQLPSLKRLKNGRLDNHFPNCLEIIRYLDPHILGLTYDEFNQEIRLLKPQLPSIDEKQQLLTENIIRAIRSFLIEKTQVDWSKENISEAVRTVALENRNHPVRNYLKALVWDGIPRLDMLLIKYVGAKDDAYVRAIAAKTMIAAVRRIMQPGCKFDNVLVLEGEQGCGKSSFVKKLLPNAEWFSDTPLSNLDSKDTVLTLQGHWIIELGEMSVLSKSDIEALKAFISRTTDNIRRPYEKTPEKIPRQYILIGTTNQSSYLKDQTGNRRFWPVAVNKIDLEALEIDRDQLWAEAVYRESIELPREIWLLARQEQEGRVAEDPWCELIKQALDSTSKLEGIIHLYGESDTPDSKTIDRIHTTDILTYLLEIPPGKLNSSLSVRLKTVMDTIGWEYKPNIRVYGKQGKGYQRRL